MQRIKTICRGYVGAWVLVILTSCAAEMSSHKGDGQVPIYLTTSVEAVAGAATRTVNTAIQSVQLEAGQTFHAYFEGGATTVESLDYSAEGDGTVTAASQPYFTFGGTSTTVHGYYPSTVTETTPTFSVQQDQTTDAAYRSSDLMYGEVTLVKSGTTVNGLLTFSHRMSKVMMTVTPGEGISKILGVRIVGGYRTVSIATPKSCTLGTTQGDALNTTSSFIKLYEGESSVAVSCAGVMPPQKINGAFLQVVTDKGAATFSLYNKSLQSSRSYVLTLTVNAVSIGTTTTIDAWDAGWDQEMVNNGGRVVVPESVDAVDLGLPSGMKWARMNLGAVLETDRGEFYAWGSLDGWENGKGKDSFQSDFSTYKWADGSGRTNILTKYCYDATMGKDGFTDTKRELDSEDDAVHMYWGGHWRMPTRDDYLELNDNCTFEWKTNYKSSGMNGQLVTSTINGNSIFMPSSGSVLNGSHSHSGHTWYWTKSLHTTYSSDGFTYRVEASGKPVHTVSSGWRFYGMPIRPVWEPFVSLSDITSSSTAYKGWYIAPNGKAYETAAVCLARSGSAPVARIVYVGSVPGYFDHFLAIALEDATTTTGDFDTQMAAANAWTASHGVTVNGTVYNSSPLTAYDQVANGGSTSKPKDSGAVKGWRVPSVTDWKYIFDGIGGKTIDHSGITDSFVYSSDVASGTSDDSHRALLNRWCGLDWDATTAPTAIQTYRYVTSSELDGSTSGFWRYAFDGSKFWYTSKNDLSQPQVVRAVFAY